MKKKIINKILHAPFEFLYCTSIAPCLINGGHWTVDGTLSNRIYKFSIGKALGRWKVQLIEWKWISVSRWQTDGVYRKNMRILVPCIQSVCDDVQCTVYVVHKRQYRHEIQQNKTTKTQTQLYGVYIWLLLLYCEWYIKIFEFSFFFCFFSNSKCLCLFYYY